MEILREKAPCTTAKLSYMGVFQAKMAIFRNFRKFPKIFENWKFPVGEGETGVFENFGKFSKIFENFCQFSCVSALRAETHFLNFWKIFKFSWAMSGMLWQMWPYGPHLKSKIFGGLCRGYFFRYRPTGDSKISKFLGSVAGKHLQPSPCELGLYWSYFRLSRLG